MKRGIFTGPSVVTPSNENSSKIVPDNVSSNFVLKLANFIYKFNISKFLNKNKDDDNCNEDVEFIKIEDTFFFI